MDCKRLPTAHIVMTQITRFFLCVFFFLKKARIISLSGGTNGKMLSFREEKMLNVTERMDWER